MNVYVREMSEEMMAGLVRNLKKWMPEHRPILTVVGVTALGLEGMRLEVEVVAHEREGQGEVKLGVA